MEGEDDQDEHVVFILGVSAIAARAAARGRMEGGKMEEVEEPGRRKLMRAALF